MRNCRPTLFDRRYTSGFLCGSKKDIWMAMAINGHQWPSMAIRLMAIRLMAILDCFSIWFWDILGYFGIFWTLTKFWWFAGSATPLALREFGAGPRGNPAGESGGEILCWKCCEDVVRPVEQNVWWPQMWPCFFFFDLKHVEHIYIYPLVI